MIRYRAGFVGGDECLIIESLRAGIRFDGIAGRKIHTGHGECGGCAGGRRGGFDLEFHPELGEAHSFIILQFEKGLVGAWRVGCLESIHNIHFFAWCHRVVQIFRTRSADAIPTVVNGAVITVPGACATVLQAPALGERFARAESGIVQWCFADEGRRVTIAWRTAWHDDRCAGGDEGGGCLWNAGIGGKQNGLGILRFHGFHGHGDGGSDRFILSVVVGEYSAAHDAYGKHADCRRYEYPFLHSCTPSISNRLLSPALT